VLIVEEGVGIRLAKIRLQATDGNIHVGHLPSGGVRLLSIDTDVIDVLLIRGTPYRIFKPYGSSIIFLFLPYLVIYSAKIAIFIHSTKLWG